MGASAVGKVVLVPFPFSDLSNAKLRPAVVLAGTEKGDLILAQITSNPYSDSLAIEISDNHFEEGSLKRVSYVRPGKLFTSSENLLKKYVGTLNQTIHKEIIETIIRILRGYRKK